MTDLQLRAPDKILINRVFDHIQKLPAASVDNNYYDLATTTKSVWLQSRWMSPLKRANPFSKELADGRFRIIEQKEEEEEEEEDGTSVRLLVVETDIKSIDCGTAACFAGWAVLLTDNGRYQPVVEQTYRFLPDCRISVWITEFRSGVIWDSEKEETTTIGQVAAELLGLDQLRAGRLFNGDNTLDEIGEIVKAINEDRSDEWFESCGEGLY